MHAAARIRSEPRARFYRGDSPARTRRAAGRAARPTGKEYGSGTAARVTCLPSGRAFQLFRDGGRASSASSCVSLEENHRRSLIRHLSTGASPGTTSSYVRPASAPDLHRFPRFNDAARHSWVAQIEEGDLLCIPPCWWHHVEAAPGVNLMINAFVWSLPPRQECELETLRAQVYTSCVRSRRGRIIKRPKPAVSGIETSEIACRHAVLSRAARVLLEGTGPYFLRPEEIAPNYWRIIAKMLL